jgi:hypothetical protein
MLNADKWRGDCVLQAVLHKVLQNEIQELRYFLNLDSMGYNESLKTSISKVGLEWVGNYIASNREFKLFHIAFGLPK